LTRKKITFHGHFGINKYATLKISCRHRKHQEIKMQTTRNE